MMKVNKDSFRFKTGSFDCVVIGDGMLTIPDTRPREPSSQDNKPKGYTMDIMCLLIKTWEHAVLVDTGFGAGERPGSGKLLQNWPAAGVQPAGIDTVVHSHLHGDHIGGNVDSKGRAIFPNAQHICHKREWEFWTSLLGQKHFELGFIQATVAGVQKNLVSIQNRLKFVDAEGEIVPGIRFINAPGHTPGNIALEISSGSEQLLCIGDLLHLPLEFTEPDLFQVLDTAHEQAVLTRNRVLSQAAERGTLVFACHFPFPGLGHVVQKGGVFQWQPI